MIEALPGRRGPGRPEQGEPPIMAEDYLKERLREIKLA